MTMKKLIAIALAGSLSIGGFLPFAFAQQPQPCLNACPVGHSFGNGGTWVPFAIMGCASGIILAASVANYRDNRELTAPEAWSCGILFWFSPPKKPRGRP